MVNLRLFLFLSVFNLNLSFGQKTESILLNDNVEKADSLFRICKYDSASVYYCKAASLYEKAQNWLSCVKSYRLTSNALLKAAKCDTALYYTHKALDIAETRFRERKDEIFEKSDVFINMADVREKKGKFKEELALCKKAMELILKADSSASLRIAAILNKTGVAYTNLGNHISGLQYCDSALHIRIRLLGEKNIDVAESYYMLGITYINKGENEKALNYLQKALTIRISDFGEKHPGVADCYNNIGRIYYDNGSYDNALEYFQIALKIRISIYGLNHPEVASCYNNIGLVLQSKGEFDKALKSSQKALQIRISFYGVNHPSVAVCYNNVGLIYLDKEEYDKALEFFQMALDIWTSVYKEKHADVALGYDNIGFIYQKKKEYDKALECSQKALKIRISVYGENHPEVALSYNNIGVIFSHEGEFDKALEYFKKALSISTNVKNNPLIALNYNNIGASYQNKREYDKALECYQKSLKLRILVYGENNSIVAESYKNIAEIYSGKGNHIAALQFYQKSLMSNVVGFADSSAHINPILANILSESVFLKAITGKANVFYQLSRNKATSYRDILASISSYELAFQLINKMRNEYNIEGTKLLLSENTKEYYAQALHVFIEFAKLVPSQENSVRPFEFLEKSKSATMTAMFNDYNAQHFARIPDSLLEMEKGLRTRIGNFATQIANQKFQKNGYDTLKVNALENENFTCSRKLDSLITYFETTYPSYYQLKYANKIASIPEIQKSLDSNTAILNYFIGDSSLFVATITDSLYKMEEIPIDSSFKKQITGYYRDIKTAEEEHFVTNSQQIYAKLIKPVEGYIFHKEHLIVIPDDYLYYVPFETLVGSSSATKKQYEDYSKPNYLIKFHSISYHHSATLWYNSRKMENESIAKQKVNFIGFAPVFSKEKNNGTILSSNINTIDTTRNSLVYRSISADLKTLNPLPYSNDEVTSIVHLFEKRRKEAKAYLYSAASESNFKNNIEGYSFIHISSHGFSNDKEPALSGIVFSQPKDTSDKEDGILYTGETYNLRLNADLIVLSSCESGIGKLIKGEGLQALSRGFLYAGASNVIFSLWKALDKPTKDLMVQFYSHVLDGTSYPESLRLAKLNLINDPKTAFPHFWSGFVLVGK